MPSPWIAVLLVLIVAALSLLLRRTSGGRDETIGTVTPSGDSHPKTEFDPEDQEAPEDPDERIPVTAEGVALVRTGVAQIALIPMIQSQEVPDWVRTGIEDSSVPYQVLNQIYGLATHGSHGARPGMTLSAGDFTAARIRRDGGAWRVETLGRDGDFGFFPFESEKGARGALELLQGLGVVHVELDEELRPIPPSPEDFEEARRRYEETERALALENEPGEGLSPGEYSDRR